MSKEYSYTYKGCYFLNKEYLSINEGCSCINKEWVFFYLKT